MLLVSAFTLVQAQTPQAKIAFDTTQYDFGEILEVDGPVSHDFMFTNNGTLPLVISKVQPSCGCTTPEWTKEPIVPMNIGLIKVTYNPKNRPGPFSKTISVYSNAETPTVVLHIKGNVLRNEAVKEEYKYSMGDLKIKNIHAAFGSIIKGEVETKTVDFSSSYTEPVTISFDFVPEHIKIKAVPERINPGQKGVFEIEYNSKDIDDWDYIIDRIKLLVNGNPVDNNTITVTALLKEDFSKLTNEDLANAPKVFFESDKYDFGTIKPSKIIEHEYVIKNIGKSDLIIRKVRASCGCTIVQPDDNIIKPGKSTLIKARFNSAGKSGDQKYAITVITNDPKVYKKILWLEGSVVSDESANTNGHK